MWRSSVCGWARTSGVGNEAGVAQTSRVHAVAPEVVVAEQLPGHLGDAVHRPRPLDGVLGRVLRGGPGPERAYGAREEDRAAVKAGRLEDVEKPFHVDFPGQEGVVLKYREVHVGTGVEVAVTESVRASLSVGGMFGRSLQYRDSVGKVIIEEGFYTQLRFTAAF